MSNIEESIKRLSEWKERIKQGIKPEKIRNIHTGSIHTVVHPDGKDDYVGDYGVMIETDESQHGVEIKHFTKSLDDYEPYIPPSASTIARKFERMIYEDGGYKARREGGSL